MVSKRVCPICERRVALRQDGSGLRLLHYINDTRAFSYELKVCKGSHRYGSTPTGAMIAQAKKDAPDMTCPYCNQKVRKTKDFRPRKHVDKDGRDCTGWKHNRR